MLYLRWCLLILMLCFVLTACRQTDQAMLSLQGAEAVAVELKDMVGLRPSTRAIWENGEFTEFVIEFSQALPGFNADEIAEKAQSVVANHFGAYPRQLTVRLADPGDE